ncbi:integrin beta-1-binding protein 1-like [Saccostrea cucullata]|uniref:integrin beta-1-binding protein 1-like n=1 Tax=Saccostrea cuccullata TaxID=36930 RepID=UPI002ED64640
MFPRKNLKSSTGINENTMKLKEKEHILMQKKTFDVYYLGNIEKIAIGNSQKRDTEAQLIDRVEEAQISGDIPITVGEKDQVFFTVSRHGIQVQNKRTQEVVQRHPLHTIAEVVQYEDGFGRPNIALKIGQLQVNKEVFQCFVFQCHSEELANDVCQLVRRIFDAITDKS